jgi:RNA polymerase sigma-54 factor
MKDSYVLTLNDDLFPNVVIRQDYQKMLNILDKKNNKLENELYKYLREKVQSGMEMMRSLEQRKKTIYRVAEAVVRRQTGFMEYGTQFVQPLRLKDIAEELDMHESTISRATQGKYMQTPHGVFEFKYFFANGLPAGGGGEVSSVSVKNRIKHLIERENPGSPLSDAKICELLAREGIDISRRTVAKYREELNIPSSAKRKRYY